LDTTGEAPVDVNLSQADDGVDMTFAMVNASAVPQVGAVPKAVSLNELHLAHGEHGWRCSRFSGAAWPQHSHLLEVCRGFTSIQVRPASSALARSIETN
jgi:hypothetical protein